MSKEFNYHDYSVFSDTSTDLSPSMSPIKFDAIMLVIQDIPDIQAVDIRIRPDKSRIEEPNILKLLSIQSIIKTLSEYLKNEELSSESREWIQRQIESIKCHLPYQISGCMKVIRNIERDIDQQIPEGQRAVDPLPQDCLTFGKLKELLNEKAVNAELKKFRKEHFTDIVCQNMLEISKTLNPNSPQFFLWDAEGHTSVVMNCGGKDGIFYFLDSCGFEQFDRIPSTYIICPERTCLLETRLQYDTYNCRTISRIIVESLSKKFSELGSIELFNQYMLEFFDPILPKPVTTRKQAVVYKKGIIPFELLFVAESSRVHRDFLQETLLKISEMEKHLSDYEKLLSKNHLTLIQLRKLSDDQQERSNISSSKTLAASKQSLESRIKELERLTLHLQDQMTIIRERLRRYTDFKNRLHVIEAKQKPTKVVVKLGETEEMKDILLLSGQGKRATYTYIEEERRKDLEHLQAKEKDKGGYLK